MFALGRALQRRQHSVTVFQAPAIEERVHEQGLGFYPVGGVQSSELAESIQNLAERRGLGSLRFAVQGAARMSDLLCRELPEILRGADVEMVLADQNEPAAATVAEYLGLPFVSVCPSLPLNRAPGIPPPFVPWGYSGSAWARLRNRIGYSVTDRLIAPINATINRHRRGWGLKPIRTPDDTFSPLAQLSQMVPEIDFPRRALPPNFHYLGPFHGAEPSSLFPFDKLNGKPLIYASLGTLQAGDSHYFRYIAEACAGLDAQLALATGGAPGTEPPRDLPGDPVVVRFAPQTLLLRRAALCITHAGMNTTMQALAFGVPLVALPITHDQPGIAARVAYSGAGVTIPMQRVTVARLRQAVETVLREPRYRERAQAIAGSIASAGGVDRGAQIVEQVFVQRSATA